MVRHRIKNMVKSMEEKSLLKLGVPREYWGIKLKDLSFRQTTLRGEKISSVAQRHWCESLLLDPPYSPLIVASSAPTGTGAMALASWLFRHRLRFKRMKAFFNLALPVSYSVREYSTVGGHNILHEATASRCEIARDLMVAYDNNFRILSVSGSKTPEAWALNKMRLQPTMVFLLKDI